MAEYILCITERHNSLVVVFVVRGLEGLKVAVCQAGLGICFPAGRKHVTMINEMILDQLKGLIPA